MTNQLGARNGLFRGLKLILFFACLLAFSVAALVLLLTSKSGSASVPLSWSTFLNGTYLESLENQTSWIQRDIFFDDQTPPNLTLSGGEQIDVEVGGTYTEPGYSATGSLGESLNQNVDAQIDGDYLLYTVTDLYGNTTTAKRSIRYVDTTPPVITLNEGTDVHVIAGTDFQDPGYIAIDNSDGDVTADVTVSGSVEKYTLGTYTLTYTVSDSLGNQSTLERTVHVDAAEQPAEVSQGDKVIYLTFDDGPYEYTEKLLDILDKYNVKATFFVTDQFNDYIDMIGEEAKRGHTVGVHTYSHDFDEIYASEDAFFADFNKMNDIIEQQTGKRSTILRFAGGSSNTISDFNPGIMTTLTKDVVNMGYQYFDWNVSSGDAGETTDTSTVVANVTKGIESNGSEPNVVLQHDIKGFSVDAVEQIIKWGLDNGYTFLPLTSDSPAVRHGVNN